MGQAPAPTAPVSLRPWREQLHEDGVSDAVILFADIQGIGDGYISYPCEYAPRINHDSQTIVTDKIRRTRTLKDLLKLKPDMIRFKNPDEAELPNGELPLFYTSNYQALRRAIELEGGTLHLFEGDKDPWTAMSAGYGNSAGILSAGAHIDDRLALQFKELGVKSIRYYPDADSAGWDLAAKLREVVVRYGIKFSVYHLPFFVDTIRIKDTSDIWKAIKFDPKRYRSILDGLRELVLPTAAQREYSKENDVFEQTLYTEIENKLGYTAQDFRPDGWPKHHRTCPVNTEHEKDTEHPGFSWNTKMKIGRCFKCGETWLAKDLADFIGVDYKKHIKKGRERDPLPSIKTAIQPSQVASGTTPGQTDIGLIRTGGLSKVLMGAGIDYTNIPDGEFLYSLEDALDDYDLRLAGVKASPYPPIPNPMKIFHKLGGAGRVLERPIMIGLLGKSGGYKTSTLTTITNIYSQLGYHGIVFSPEWNAQRTASRVVQQHGGLRMMEMSLYERWLYEQARSSQGVPLKEDALFGVRPNDVQLEKTRKVTGKIRNRFIGKVVYINSFGSNILDILGMIQEAGYRMIRAGSPPDYIIFDYAQLANAPKGYRLWGMDETIHHTKMLTSELGTATFMASQIRKNDTEKMNEEDEILTSTSGVGFRDDKFNFFWTTNPMREISKMSDGRRIKTLKYAVTKNSDGAVADTYVTALESYVDLDRLVVLQKPEDLSSVMFEIDEDDPDNDPANIAF